MRGASSSGSPSLKQAPCTHSRSCAAILCLFQKRHFCLIVCKAKQERKRKGKGKTVSGSPSFLPLLLSPSLFSSAGVVCVFAHMPRHAMPMSMLPVTRNQTNSMHENKLMNEGKQKGRKKRGFIPRLIDSCRLFAPYAENQDKQNAAAAAAIAFVDTDDARRNCHYHRRRDAASSCQAARAYSSPRGRPGLLLAGDTRWKAARCRIEWPARRGRGRLPGAWRGRWWGDRRRRGGIGRGKY